MEFYNNILEIFVKIGTIIGMILGSIWAFFLYKKKRENVWNLNIFITHELIKLNSELSFLHLKISLKNIGAVKIIPNDNGCEVSIKSVNTDLKKYDVIDWDCGNLIVENKDILKKYINKENNNYSDTYIIEPGSVYNENFGIVVNNNYIYQIEVTFNNLYGPKNEPDCISEYSTIYVN